MGAMVRGEQCGSIVRSFAVGRNALCRIKLKADVAVVAVRDSTLEPTGATHLSEDLRLEALTSTNKAMSYRDVIKMQDPTSSASVQNVAPKLKALQWWFVGNPKKNQQQRLRIGVHILALKNEVTKWSLL